MPKYDKMTPDGTRDLLFDECEAENRIIGKLRKIFEKQSYREVKTPGLEFYDVFSSKADYYPQESMYKLSDNRGRLITARPDSTIPIARLTATKLRGSNLPLRLYYSQRVYRQQQSLRGRSGEIMQMGVELIGASTFESDMEVLTLAAKSLEAGSSANYRIEIGHVGFYKLIMAKLKTDENAKESIRRCIASKNYAALNDILDTMPESKALEIIRVLPRLFGNVEALKEATDLVGDFSKEVTVLLKYLKKIFNELDKQGLGDHFMIDFGLVNEADYYSSLVFRGYIENTGLSVLSGGRYDQLFSDFGEDLPATGFGINIDILTSVALKTKNSVTVSKSGKSQSNNEKVRIALTKGRLEDSFIEMMEKAGYNCDNIREKGRKLLLTIPDTNIEVFLAKAPDVITYVENGVCDIGIVGKDTILEQGGTYYEIMDLGIGKCRFAVAAPKGIDPFSGYGTKVIATKYPSVAGKFFGSKGMDVEIIKIEGSVELAPILSLADCIVDIVETGTTLKENGLVVIEEIRDISARLIVNISEMKLKKVAIEDFTSRLAEVLPSNSRKKKSKG